MKNFIIGLGTLVVVVSVALLIIGGIGRTASGPVACTEEAKICPDGSAVGRSGPNCEFAECPSAPESTTLGIRMGAKGTGLGVSITPLEVLEDSRCPSDVTCIWEGKIRVKTLLASGEGEATQEFTLDKPITTEAETVTLTKVFPHPEAGVKIKDSDYTFQFKIVKR